jgi:hypothetical protein
MSRNCSPRYLPGWIGKRLPMSCQCGRKKGVHPSVHSYKTGTNERPKHRRKCSHRK